MADKNVSDTLTGGPKQGRGNEANKPERASGGRDSAGLANRGSTVGTEQGGTSRAAGLDRSREVRPDHDERMNAQVENADKETESRNVMNSASSGKRDTTTGPGEARRSPERSGNIYDPEHPDPYSNPRVE